MTEPTTPTCPKCKGPMWDNRGTPDKPKSNPKAPDWKCKDKACDGAIWSPKETALITPGEAQALAAAPNAPPAFDWKALPPEILARAASITAGVQAQGGTILPAAALAAAYHFQETGEVIGRHAYVIPTGKGAGQVWQSYRGTARELDMSRYQFRYRPMTADERVLHGIQDTWLTVICELDVLDARRQCILMQIPYQPILGIGIITPQEKIGAGGKPKDPPNARTWYWVAQKRARVDALRQVGENTSAEDVLAEAAENGIHVDVPDGARLTQEQAEHLVRDALRPPLPSGPAAKITPLGQPAGFEGFGDEVGEWEEGDFTPTALESPSTSAAWDAMTSASAERPIVAPKTVEILGPRVSDPNPPASMPAQATAQKIKPAVIVRGAPLYPALMALLDKLDAAGVSHKYRNAKGIDSDHVRYTLAAHCGITEITPENLPEVIGKLEAWIIGLAQAAPSGK